MPSRSVVFANNQIYHVFNRSVGKEPLFTSLFHQRWIKELINYYRYPQTLRFSQFKLMNKDAKNTYLFTMRNKQQLIEIYAFAFMPNHYHFLLKQLSDDGIIRFISNIQNSYAKSYNLKNERKGTLFQNSFQAKWIETDEQFIHISRYIHLNPVTAYIINFEKLATYPFTSFADYILKQGTPWLNKSFLLSMFKSQPEYQTFVADQVDYQQTLAALKDQIID
jgi:putative transposase